MYSKLQQLIYASTGIDIGGDNAPVDINAQIAVASLLVVAASSDGTIDSAEIVKMTEALCRRYSLSSVVALDLVSRAIDEQSVGDATALFSELNERLSKKQKEDLVLMLLEVIAADGEKESSEMALLDRAVSALNISGRQLDKIYQRYFDARRQSR